MSGVILGSVDFGMRDAKVEAVWLDCFNRNQVVVSPRPVETHGSCHRRYGLLAGRDEFRTEAIGPT